MIFKTEEVESARQAVYGVMPPTPQYAWPLLRERLGMKVWVKHENHTPAGSWDGLNEYDSEAVLPMCHYQMIGSSWRANWERVVPFLDFPPEIRKIIYTTNAIESLSSSLRKLVYHRGHFPGDEAVTKLLYLALRNLEKRWDRSVRVWSKALGQFAIFFEGRLPSA